MKKRILALTVCLAMLFSLTAFAADEAISGGSSDVSVSQSESSESAKPADDSSSSSSEEASDVSSSASSEESAVSKEESSEVSSVESSVESSETSSEESSEVSGEESSEISSEESSEESSDISGKSDIADMTVEELYHYIMQLENDTEIEAVLSQLDETTIDALMAYALEQEQVQAEIPETKVFTEAGPFMPPVNVLAAARWAARVFSYGTVDNNGLELTKTATANDDGSYTIRMEAFTTGTVKSSETAVPVDVVLVLDQSGSMAYDFSGNSTNTIANRRQYAMKQAVNNFIASMAEKYSDTADHRLAIVTFGSNASTLQGWTYVNAAGKTTLQNKINGLPNSPEGATNVAAGMKQAEALMGSGYSYTGANTSRQKVVIVFTDGVPTTSSDFDTTVATNAIASAKNLKDSGVTVYSVGIFNGANPNQLYGDSGFDRNSDGSVGSDWSDFSFWNIGDIKSYDIPAGNRFLNYLSSNFEDASEIGIKAFSRKFFGIGYTGWEITKNFDKTKFTYYLTANDSDSLNEIFQTISNNIETANIDLGSETVVKDTVSKYFDLPENTSNIRLYTAAAKEDGTFEDEVSAPAGVTAAIEGSAVSVTGFDFNANFVSVTLKEDGTYGKKLIIEFEVTPKEGFIGGNDVPTNDWKDTAVYDKNGNEVEKFANATTTPTVNVPIEEPEFTVTDKTVYLGNSTAVSGLYILPDTTGLEYDFVNVVPSVMNGSSVTGETVSPEDCTSYDIKVTYQPKTDGTNSEGTANSMEGVSTTKSATVHVLKPIFQAEINDVLKYYGESYTLGEGVTGTFSVTEWKDKNLHESIPTVEGDPPENATEGLTLSYTTSEFTGETGTVPKHDFDVTVKVMKGGEPVADATVVTTCSVTDSGCQTPEPSAVAGEGVYTVHVKTCQLTIAKTGGADDEPYVFTVYKDNAKYTEVTIVGNDSVTIYELPVGNYSIEEDTGWSWRYTATYSGNVTLSKDTTRGTITCTNTKKLPYWLNGFSDIIANISVERKEGGEE